MASGPCEGPTTPWDQYPFFRLSGKWISAAAGGLRRVARTIRSEGHEALRHALIGARKAAGLTQAQLAVRLRCHQSFVARIETGQRRVDAVELVVLARAIGLPAAELLAAVEVATPADHRI